MYAFILDGDDESLLDPPKKSARKGLSDKLKNGKISIDVNNPIMAQDVKKKRTTSTSKKKKEEVTEEQQTELPMYKSTESYVKEYNQTEELLRDSIDQLEGLILNVQGDIVELKSKSVRGKHTYLANLYGSMAGAISTKIGAIKEMNSARSKALDLDLKRAKEMSIANNITVDDDRAITELYKNIVNMPQDNPLVSYSSPVNTFSTPFGNEVYNQSNMDVMFTQYKENLTPKQKMIHHSNNQNIQNVVVYDKSTYMKKFALMDVTTGEFVDGIPMDDMFLEDTTIDETNGIARNINLNQTYKLVVVNGNDTLANFL